MGKHISLPIRFGTLSALLLAFCIYLSPQVNAQKKSEQADVALREGKSQVLRSNFQEAIPWLRSAAGEYERLGMPDLQFEALLQLEYCLEMTYQNAARNSTLNQLERHTAEVYGKTSHQHHRALIRRADHIFDLGKSDSTRRFLEALMPEFKQTQDAWALSYGHLLLGRCFQKKLDYANSEREYEIALNICKQQIPEDTSQRVFILDRMSYFYARIGLPQKGVAICKEMMNLFRGKARLSATDSLEIAKCYLDFTEVYSVGGDPDLATEHGEEALRLFQCISISHPRFLGQTYHVLSRRGSSFYSNEEEKAIVLKMEIEADKYLSNPTDKIMALYHYHNSVYLSGQVSMGMEYRHKKMFEAKSLAEKWGIDPQPWMISASLIAFHEYDFKQANEFAHKSLKEYHKEYGLEDCSTVSRGFSHLLLGMIAYYASDLDSSMYYLQLASQDFTISFKDDNPVNNPSYNHGIAKNSLFEVLHCKGLVWYKMYLNDGDLYNLKMAFQTHVAALEITYALRNNFVEKRAKLDLSVNDFRHCEGVIKTGLRLFEATGDTSYLNRSFWASEIAKSQLLLESWARSKVYRSIGVPEYALQVEDSLKKELAFLEGLMISENEYGEAGASSPIDQLKERAAKTRQMLRNWEKAVENHFPGSQSQWKSKAIPSITEIQQEYLGEEEAMVEYFVGKDELYVFYIRQDEANGIRLDKPDNFESTIVEFNNSLNNYTFVTDSVDKGYKQFTRTSHQLFQWLLRAELAEKDFPEKLMVIPDVGLNDVPFEVLLTRPDTIGKVNYIGLPYLIRQSEVQYSPSAALLMNQGRMEESNSIAGCLGIAPGGFGAPVRSASGDLAMFRDGELSLEGTQQEVGMIGKIGIPGHFLIGDSATEFQFKDLGPRYQIVHLATHGKADLEHPEKSSLLFSRAPWDTLEDHVLHAFELDGLSFQADLVVLSACETDVGKYTTGEGSMSLARGFLANGVSSVIATLWRVEDQNSARLMERFYQHLAAGEASGSALHRAKLDALKHADSKTAHPYFWSGYVSKGLSRKFDFNMDNGWSAWWWILPGFGLAGIMFWWVRGRNGWGRG